MCPASAVRASILVCCLVLPGCADEPAHHTPADGGADSTDLVACGASTCDTAQNEQCCYTTTQGVVGCAASCAQDALAVVCDGPEDCGGDACCGTLFAGYACEAAATCTSTGQLCHVKADCPAGFCCLPFSSLGFELAVCTEMDGC
jgi:hypothetical protein